MKNERQKRVEKKGFVIQEDCGEKGMGAAVWRNLDGKRESRRNQEQSIWVSQEQKCIYFRYVPGYRKIRMSDHDKLQELILYLIDKGYKIG